jgi:hypothetical protein
MFQVQPYVLCSTSRAIRYFVVQHDRKVCIMRKSLRRAVVATACAVPMVIDSGVLVL